MFYSFFAAMATTIGSFRSFFPVALNLQHDPCFHFCSSGSLRSRNSCHSHRACACFSAKLNDRRGFYRGSGKVLAESRFGEVKEESVEKLIKPLWDDGFGTVSAKDYIDATKDIIVMSDGGPPRWFCPVECGPPLKDSPLLMFLPGKDGLGAGLVLHHKALGRVFEVRCLHVPVHDRTPFEELVKLVETSVRIEHASSKRPTYLLGESLGGCVALSVAARNPTIDLVLLLVNPAISVSRSQLQAVLPYLEAFPKEFHKFIPYLIGFALGDPIKMAMVNNESHSHPSRKLAQFSDNLAALLSLLSDLGDILPKETILWKLKMLEAGAAYTNSRLHAVKAEVLLLASGTDRMFLSRDEVKRLACSIENCKVRYFKDHGHFLLIEDGINLLTIIKGTCLYRRSSRRDFVLDFLPPSMSELKNAFDQRLGLYHLAISPVMFSTLENGKIVRGLGGVPDEGPVLLVGYHSLFGADIGSLIEAFLREKNIMVHGLAHPGMFKENFARESSNFDLFKVFGAMPVTTGNFFKLLSTKSHVLLYPGGVREAIHSKGESYKLFWPDQPEFVRIAAKYGATIIPFGVVGEDDIVELFFDYNDFSRLPVLKHVIRKRSPDDAKSRTEVIGQDGRPDFFVPVFHPKLPGRFYFLFGKPIETKGKEELLQNRGFAKELYLQIKAEVEQNIAYLINKRGQDPYRHIFRRILYRAICSPNNLVPSFDP